MVQVENKTLQWFGASLDASSSAADTAAIVVVRSAALDIIYTNNVTACLADRVELVSLFKKIDKNDFVFPAPRPTFFSCRIKRYKRRSNLVKGGIAVNPTPRLYSPDGSSNLRLHVLAGGSTPNFPFLLGQGPRLTQCVTGPHKCTCQIAYISRTV